MSKAALQNGAGWVLTQRRTRQRASRAFALLLGLAGAGIAFGQAAVPVVVPWTTLAQVDLIKGSGRFAPKFSDSVLALDTKQVRLQGFVVPLELGDKQKHFLLSAMPQTCAFCLPGGPESLVEVKARTPVRYGFEPLTIRGKLSVLRDDPSGIYYRLTDATPESN